MQNFVVRFRRAEACDVPSIERLINMNLIAVTKNLSQGYVYSPYNRKYLKDTYVIKCQTGKVIAVCIARDLTIEDINLTKPTQRGVKKYKIWKSKYIESLCVNRFWRRHDIATILYKNIQALFPDCRLYVDIEDSPNDNIASKCFHKSLGFKFIKQYAYFNSKYNRYVLSLNTRRYRNVDFIQKQLNNR